MRRERGLWRGRGVVLVAALGARGVEEGEGLVAGTGLDLVDAVDGAEIDGVDGESVEGVGGERGDIAGGETLDHVGDEVRLGVLRMDAEGLGRQGFLLLESY